MENETHADGTPTDQKPSNSGSTGQEPRPLLPELSYYDMSKKKILLVFNHEIFDKPSFWSDAPSKRRGTLEDAMRLRRVFEHLKFNVTVYKDLTREYLFNVIDNLVELDHKNTSCVVVAILTHGSNNGELFAKDGIYNVNNIISKFEAKSLLQIPKVFLIQACRGGKTDSGQYIQLDGGNRAVIKIPTHGDFLVLYSTIEGYLSYREASGSWMIQTFCQVLREYHESMDMLHIITLVNDILATDFVSRSLDPAINDKKQISEARYTLRKLLKF